MNSKQRRQAREQKRLLQLGRDAKQVQAVARTNEENARNYHERGVQLKVSVDEKDKEISALKRQIGDMQTALEAANRTVDELRSLIQTGNGVRDALEDTIAELRRKLEQRKDDLAEVPKLRRRLQEKELEIERLGRKVQKYGGGLLQAKKEVDAARAVVKSLGVDPPATPVMQPDAADLPNGT